jgi:hypothetical protein
VAKPAHIGRVDAYFFSVLFPRQFVDVARTIEWFEQEPLRERRSHFGPLIAFGGQYAIAPAPLAEMADVVALGDGEVTGVHIARLLKAGYNRVEIMRDLHGQRGFWCPGHDDGPPHLTRAETPTLDPVAVYPGNDRAVPTVEAARGCASKCAFCTIGWAGGTYREAKPAALDAALYAHRGRAVNLFAPDLSSIRGFSADDVIERQGCRQVARDARLDHVEPRPGVRSYSFGVEGLSERLRALIGKPLKRSAILETMTKLAPGESGTARWYMILGLPGETDEDLAEFLDLLAEVPAVYHKKLDVTLTILQPAPHTPLQWMDGHYPVAAAARATAIRDWCRAAYYDGRQGLITTSMPKGRWLHEHDVALQRAGRDAIGYLLDKRCNEPRMHDERWRGVAADNGLDVGALLAPLDPAAEHAWSHVDVGVPRERVIAQWRRIEASGREVAA